MGEPATAAAGRAVRARQPTAAPPAPRDRDGAGARLDPGDRPVQGGSARGPAGRGGGGAPRRDLGAAAQATGQPGPPVRRVTGPRHARLPADPAGDAYPSAHTAVVVALSCAMWPWLRPNQRIVAVVLVVLIPFDRVYVGAHWPIDLAGGAAVGLLAAAVAWLVAARWPLTPGPDPMRARRRERRSCTPPGQRAGPARTRRGAGPSAARRR